MVQLFGRIASAGHSVGSAAKLNQLNAIRNDVKHLGLYPNPVIARQLVPEIISFADSLASSFISKSLRDIHMTDAITSDEFRRSMDLIQTDIEREDYGNALEKMAFVIFEVYERSTFGFRRLQALISGRPLSEFAFPEIDHTEQRLYFVELGLDPQDYESFHYLVPRVGLRSGSDTAFIMEKNRHTWHVGNWTHDNCTHAFDFLLRLILAQQERPGPPPVTSINPVDRITFIRDSEIYDVRDQRIPVGICSSGDTLYVSALPFVDGNWQNFGEETVLVTVLGGDWRVGYIRKADVEVLPDVELPKPLGY